MADLAVVGQDPGFGGGIMGQTAALWDAALALGRSPELHYLRYRRLDADRSRARLTGRAVQPVLPDLDIANVLVGSCLVARRVREAPSRFVCTATASAGYAAVLARKPYACWISTTLAEEDAPRRSGLRGIRRLAHAANLPALQRLERATLRRAAVRWTISPASRSACAVAAGLPESAIRVVPIPVDTARFPPLAEDEWTAGLDAPRLVFVGRADDPRKNLPLLLKVFSLLRRELPTATLELIGAPPRGPLPEGVRAAGFVPSVAETLARGALLVLPSHQEGFGIVAAEALACGVPVLSTPSGGPEELLRASGGGAVSQGFDPAELAGLALDLLGDRDRLTAMRHAGRAWVEREHDPARLQEALAEALAELEA